MTHNIRIGTRSSKLALAQANQVKSLLQHAHQGLDVELVKITTSGDKITDRPLATIGGKGLFTKEIEEALLGNEIDIAVHSLKDMPALLPDGLVISCLLTRENPFDALLCKEATRLDDLPPHAIIGTSSLRRKIQLSQLRPDLKIKDLRGNVDTRIAKLHQGEFDAIILATAGLNRLDLSEHISSIFTPEQMLPAVAQGAIGIELRKNNSAIEALLAPLHDHETAHCVSAERAFLEQLNGNCTTPIAAFATLDGKTIHLEGLLASPDGKYCYRNKVSGSSHDKCALGGALIDAIRADAGDHFTSLMVSP